MVFNEEIVQFEKCNNIIFKTSCLSCGSFLYNDYYLY